MKRSTIRTKLALIILVILLPMMAVQLMSITDHFQQVLDAELEANYDFAQALSHIYGNYIASIVEDLDAMAPTASHLAEEDIAQLQRYLERTLDHYPSLLNISWASPQGNIISSTNRLAMGSNVENRYYFQQLLSGRYAALSEVVFGLASGEARVFLARAYRVEGALAGVVIATINVERFEEIMPPKRIGRSSSFGIVDRLGVIVYQEGLPEIYKEMITVHSEGPARQALITGQTVKNKKFISSVTHSSLLAVAVPIPELGWVVYANTEYDEVWARALRSITPTIAVLILSTTASLLLSCKIYREISKPMTQLHWFAEEVASGNLEARADINSIEELAYTAEALNKMTARIKVMEKSRRMFIQSSAHELRNPLTGVKGVFQVLRFRLIQGLSTEEGLEIVTVGEEEIDRVTTILNQLLAAFKEENSQFDVDQYCWTEVELTPLLSRIVDVFQLGSPTHHFKLEMGSQPALIRGDAAKLETVFRNVLHNAVKYSPEGSQVTIGLEVKESLALVKLADQGIGIPPQDLESIFESFFRSESPHKDPGGMGLGLYLAREIVQKHQGRIWAESQDKGSIFTIQLPLA